MLLLNPQHRRFTAPNRVFLDENFLTRRFSEMLKCSGERGIAITTAPLKSMESGRSKLNVNEME